MSVGKASIRRAAGAGKTAGGAGNIKASTGDVVKSVVTPLDSEKIQVKFISGQSSAEKENRPVRLTEEMPDYLL